MSPYEKFRSLSKWVQLSLCSSILQIIIICTLEGFLFNSTVRFISIYEKFSSEKKDEGSFLKFKALPVYFGLFFFAQFFQFILCIDAALFQNTIQICMLALFNFMLLFYGCTQLNQTLSTANKLKSTLEDIELPIDFPKVDTMVHLEISIIVLLVLFSCSFAFVAFKLYQEYGWNIYKRIGADLQLKRMFMVYHIFVMILKFDILFFISFSTQYICLVIIPYEGKAISNDFIIHLSVSLVICIVLSILAFWSVKNENKYGIFAFFMGCVGVLGYFISKLLAIYVLGTEEYRKRFDSSRITLTVFIVFCILFAIFTCIGSVFCYKNFGRGLKSIISNEDHGKLLLDERVNARNNSRWSLD